MSAKPVPYFLRVLNRLIRPFDLEVARSQFILNRVKSGEFAWLRNQHVATVLDVGANTGQFAAMIRAILPDAYIYSFEPLRGCFNALQEQTRSLKNIQCFHCALGSSNGKTTIHANEFSPSSSLLTMSDLHKESFPYTKNTVEETIEIRTLDSFLPELRLQKKVMVKIDVQGFELNVLRGAEAALANVDILIIETSFYELYVGQPLFEEVHRHMTERGFSYRGNFDQVYSAVSGEVLQADAIYIRRGESTP